MPNQEPNQVVVTNFDIEFWSLVTLMVKIALASFPAAIILGLISGLSFVITRELWRTYM